IQLARVPEENFRLSGNIGIREFLRLHKQGRELLKADQWAEQNAADTRIRLNAELHCADCGSFNWPGDADTIVGDPPWDDDQAYSWLAKFAQEQLREGGLLFVQCGQATLHQRYQPFLDAGLRHHWTMAIVYEDLRACEPKCWFAQGWRPVLVFAKGK